MIIPNLNWPEFKSDLEIIIQVERWDLVNLIKARESFNMKKGKISISVCLVVWLNERTTKLSLQKHQLFTILYKEGSLREEVRGWYGDCEAFEVEKRTISDQSIFPLFCILGNIIHKRSDWIPYLSVMFYFYFLL